MTGTSINKNGTERAAANVIVYNAEARGSHNIPEKRSTMPTTQPSPASRAPFSGLSEASVPRSTLALEVSCSPKNGRKRWEGDGKEGRVVRARKERKQ
jgi:hypothetical protein